MQQNIAMVIGYSHLKRIKWNLFKNSFDNAKSFIKSFGRTKTEHMKHVIPSLKEQKPDIIVIHAGSIAHKGVHTPSFF